MIAPFHCCSYLKYVSLPSLRALVAWVLCLAVSSVCMGCPTPPKETRLVYAGDACISCGDPITAQLTDSEGNAVPKKNVTFAFDNCTLSAETDAAGIASVSVPLDQRSGDGSLHGEFDGDTDYASSDFDTTLSIRKACGHHETTQLVYEGNPRAVCGYPIRAVLRDSGGKALTEKEVTFRLGQHVLSATTDAAGVATAHVPLEMATGDWSLRAVFAGDFDYRGCSVDAPLSIRKLSGLCYGPFRDGQDPMVGANPTVPEIEQDMAALASLTHTIRTYGASGTLGQIPGIAKAHGLSVWQGARLSTDNQGSRGEIDRAVETANQGLADAVIVGNETLLLNVLTKEQLIEYLKEARAITPAGIPVTTGEGWKFWMDNPDLVDQVDFILAHIYSYWDADPRDGGLAYVIESYRSLRERYPDKRIVIGETGWPSAGVARGGAAPGEENQRQFLQGFAKWASDNSVEYTYFDAFDEEWKWREGVESGSYTNQMPTDRDFSGRYAGSSWGLVRSDGTVKPWLAEFLGNGIPAIESRSTRSIYTGEALSAGYDLGVNSSGNQTRWLADLNGSMQMAYPANQNWGAVFLTLQDKDHSAAGARPWRDFSRFRSVSVDLKGEHGGESVQLGIKDRSDPDDGFETKVTVDNLSTEWATFVFPLSAFTSADLEEVYMPMEFVFTGPEPQTVYFRNVRYLAE